jgi:apocytochrome f
LKKRFSLIFRIVFSIISSAWAYPIFAQQNYAFPREANGRIVCANCHLAQKPVELELPQAVFPDTVFEAIIRIPYSRDIEQVLGNGKLGGLNVGAVLVLPDGFQLAPTDRIDKKTTTQKLSFQPYSRELKNILVVGPLTGTDYQEISVPILAPDPKTDRTVRYNKYPVYLGGNRGRGQVYPDGSKSNNTVYTSSATGVVKDIAPGKKKGGFQIFVSTVDGNSVTELIPPGPKLLVKVGDSIRRDDPLTNNPNVGGFGQTEGEIVLQDRVRVYRLLAFFRVVFITQIFLVIKKKQFEKVQLSEINF